MLTFGLLVCCQVTLTQAGKSNKICVFACRMFSYLCSFYKYKQIKLRWALFVTYTIIQSIMRSEMCSLHLTHPSAHTWSSGQPTMQSPGEQSWTFCRSRDSNPQPWVTSGFKSNALSTRPPFVLLIRQTLPPSPLPRTWWFFHQKYRKRHCFSLTSSYSKKITFMKQQRGKKQNQVHYFSIMCMLRRNNSFNFVSFCLCQSNQYIQSRNFVNIKHLYIFFFYIYCFKLV